MTDPIDAGDDAWFGCPHIIDGVCVACCSAAITKARQDGAREERGRLLLPKLADDHGPLEVLMQFAFDGGHDVSHDPGGCEVCHAVLYGERFLRTENTNTPGDDGTATGGDRP
jgi:hypothetical protein